MIGRFAARARASPEQVLDATRMVGVGVSAVLGRLIVLPEVQLGAAGPWGAAYVGAMLGGTLLCALATLAGRVGARWFFAALVLIGAAVVLPALATDFGAAGSILAWQLWVVARVFGRSTPPRFGGPPAISPWRRVASHLLALSLFATTLVVGFRASDLRLAELICLGLAGLAIVATMLVLCSDRALPRWALPLAIVVLAVPLIARAELDAVLAALAVIESLLLVQALRGGPTFAELIQQFVQRPALLLLSTFAGIAGAGAVILTFPAAATEGRIAPLDALFTSMSATCVTGLAVLDTPTAFSTFGHVTILVLIQIGGLGMMVLSTFATVILGGRLTLRGEQALGSVLELGSPGDAYRLVRFIVAATLAIEAVGAGLLSLAFLGHGLDPADAIWRGVFHSISAFCNAGFALQSDSIVMFQSDPLVLLVHALLIIFGGLGFVVLAWLWSRAIRRERRRAPVQVRVVLWGSSLLVMVGALLYGLLEWHASLAGLSAVDKLSNAVFQSVTTRTAGFNSVDLTVMKPATILLAIGLMFIGASPGGTGGGIKVTTVAVLTAAIPDLVNPRGGASLFGRSVGPAILQRAATITVVATMTASLSLFVLLISEDAPFELLAFEVISALGTVGLTLGVTPGLSATGKLVILATMFVGRVGPLTLALALGRRTASPIAYPETRIMVG
jgi:trk system potassium uptake protein TrkH